MSLPQTELLAIDAGSTHAVDILAFVGEQEIPSLYFETPYYLAPAPGGESFYKLLREALRCARKIGIACVVIDARQHLAALIPDGQSLVLRTLRWNREERTAPAEMSRERDELAELQAPIRPDMPALTEYEMKTRKTASLQLQDADFALEDEDLINDEFLAAALRRRPHPRDGRAMRATRAPYQRRRSRGPTTLRSRAGG